MEYASPLLVSVGCANGLPAWLKNFHGQLIQWDDSKLYHAGNHTPHESEVWLQDGSYRLGISHRLFVVWQRHIYNRVGGGHSLLDMWLGGSLQVPTGNSISGNRCS